MNVVADLQNELAANNEAWGAGMRLLVRCREYNNHVYIPALIGLCQRRNIIVQEINRLCAK